LYFANKNYIDKKDISMNQGHIRLQEPLDFIAFKIPARMKRQLRVLAKQQGSNLSELVRSQCVVLLNEGVLNERVSGSGKAGSRGAHFPGEIAVAGGAAAGAAAAAGAGDRPQPRRWSV